MPSSKNPKKKSAKRRQVSPRGFIRTTVMLTPDQIAWLEEQARVRMTPAAYVLRALIDNVRMDTETAWVGTQGTTVAKSRP
jgi:hypothetical protein